MPGPLLALAAIPLLSISTLLCVLGGGAQTDPNTTCGGGGTGQTIAGVVLDAEQMANAQTIITVTADRGLPSYVAVVAVDTAYTESTLHNSTVETDHDSQGLFQQRVSIYTAAVADDPVQATDAFLDRLVDVPDWQTNPVGIDAQDVQISAYPDRYQPNAKLAQQLVGRLWPTAAAAATTAPPAEAASLTTAPGGTLSSLSAPTMVCAGGDGAVPLTGGHGNNVAGTTTIPTGLTLDGSAKGDGAVQFALAQLGKPYVAAAAGPNAFDCSGLTMAAWASQGIALAHLAAAQAGEGTTEPTDLSTAVSGDLVLIPGADGTPAAPGHVGIVVGYVATTTDGQPARDLWLEQAPGYQNLPLELTEATEWSGQVVDVRHIA
jgi:peptidoglycan DL-endopeptidase CwlO